MQAPEEDGVVNFVEGLAEVEESNGAVGVGGEGSSHELMKASVMVEGGEMTTEACLRGRWSEERAEAELDESLERLAGNGEERDGTVGVG